MNNFSYDFNIKKEHEEEDINSLSSSFKRRKLYNENNLSAALNHLNYELNSIGLASLNLNAEDSNTLQIIRYFFHILDKAQSSSRYNEDFEIRYRNIESDYDSAMAYSERLKATVEAKDRKIHDLTVTESSLNKEIKEKREKHKLISEEIRQLRVNHQHSLNQFAHDLRKKEVDSNKIKEKVQKIINDKYKISKISCTLLNPGQSLYDFTSKSENEDYYTEMVKNYGLREDVLAKENQELRDIITQFYEQLIQMIKTQEGTDNLNFPKLDTFHLNVGGDKTKIHKNIQKVIEMLIQICDQLKSSSKPTTKTNMHEMSTQTTESELKQKQTSIQDLEKIQKLKEELIKQQDESIILKSKITEYKNNIADLQNLLDKTIFENQIKQVELSVPDITIPEIEEAQKKIDEQRLDLEQNRKKLTEAAITLGYDRSQFLREKQLFEEEKKQFDIEKAMNSIPTAPQWIKELDINKIRSDSGISINEMQIEDYMKVGSGMSSPSSKISIPPLPEPSQLKKPHSRANSINVQPNTVNRTIVEPKTKRTPSKSVDLTKPSPTKPRPSGMASLMRPTASQILKAQEAQAKRDELQLKSGNKIALRESVRRHALSPTPCSKPNCLVHMKIKEQQLEREKKLKQRAALDKNN